MAPRKTQLATCERQLEDANKLLMAIQYYVEGYSLSADPIKEAIWKYRSKYPIACIRKLR